MRTERTGRVLVATSGSDTSMAAVARGTREAAAREAPLEIVHVVPTEYAAGPNGQWSMPVLRTAGHELLEEARVVAQDIDPSVEVVTKLLIGSRADAIVHEGEHAALILVGAAPHDPLGRFWDGSTVVGVASRAQCPVLVVPRGDTGRTHRVLVGLKSREGCDHVLRAGFAQARQSGSELRIVHAWHFTPPYEDAIAERLPTPRWEEAELRAIEGQLTDLRMTYPDVQVQVAVAHGRPGPILVAESREAGLVVISRPAHGGLVHHLGATARVVIRGAHCPVLVVPPTARDSVEPAQASPETALHPFVML